MNATVMCEKCGKPLGVFDGNIHNECENRVVLDKIRDEIDQIDIFMGGPDYPFIPKKLVLYIIDKYR